MNIEILEALPARDQEFLTRFGDNASLERDGSSIHVIFHRYDLGEAYEPRTVDLLIRLPAGYPNMALDMYWTNPSVRLRSGAMPSQCAHHQIFGAIQWQRWSRHPSQGWRTGIDGLQNFYASVRKDVNRGI